MTHTLLPCEDGYRLIHGIIKGGVPVKIINDDQMMDDRRNVYQWYYGGIVKRI